MEPRITIANSFKIIHQIQGADDDDQSDDTLVDSYEDYYEPFTHLTHMLTNVPLLLVILLTFVFNYTLYSTYFLIPLLVSLVPGWSLIYLSTTFVAHGVLHLTTLLICARVCITDEIALIMLSLSVAGFVLSRVLMTLFSFATITTDTTPCFVVVLLVVVLCVLGFGVKDALLQSLQPRPISTNTGTLQMFREVATILGIIVAASTTPFVSRELYVTWCICVVVVNVLLLLGVILVKDNLVFSRKVKFLSSMSVSTNVNRTRLGCKSYFSSI